MYVSISHKPRLSRQINFHIEDDVAIIRLIQIGVFSPSSITLKATPNLSNSFWIATFHKIFPFYRSSWSVSVIVFGTWIPKFSTFLYFLVAFSLEIVLLRVLITSLNHNINASSRWISWYMVYLAVTGEFDSFRS